jgi:hypothetical protein
MDESRAVLDRLARIEARDAAGGTAAELLGELHALLAEAEAWARREGGDAGARVVAGLRDALARDMIER